MPKQVRIKVMDVLKQDPRAAYNKKPDYVYGMSFDGYDIRFVVKEQVLVVQDVVELSDGKFTKVK